jgi:hypothetical protein
MAKLGGLFNAAEVEPSAPMELVPAGKYTVQIVQSEMKDTSTGGQYLWLEHSIVGGPFENRRLWNNLNLVNRNPQAVQIAERDLSAICHAIGVTLVEDSEQLHYKPLIATVKVRPAGRDKQGIERTAQNEIGGYEPVAVGQTVQRAQVTQQRTAQPAQATQAAPAAANTAPWKKNRTAA